VLERRQDARRERWRAAALDQLDQSVQVHGALTRELLGQFVVEAGLAQSLATPGDDLARSGLASGSKCHASLARAGGQFLPPGRDLAEPALTLL
jgi:hypothetical protein